MGDEAVAMVSLNLQALRAFENSFESRATAGQRWP
jgi:hypothetical protein